MKERKRRYIHVGMCSRECGEREMDDWRNCITYFHSGRFVRNAPLLYTNDVINE